MLQLSLDIAQPPVFHYQLGRQLSALRGQGVLLLGSGNVVHNLSRMQRHGPAAPYPWAQRFHDGVRQHLLTRDDDALIDFNQYWGDDAALAVPTPEHYLPLLYIIGARCDDDAVEIVTEGIDAAAISMLTVKMG